MNATQQLAGQLRLKILGLYRQANAGHIGCSLSCIDLITASLILNKTDDEIFILSKGHAAAALYVALHHLGEISDEQLGTFYGNGTTLSAHPAPRQHRGIPFATGSLGHGLPIGTGVAKANKLLGNDLMTFVLMSDGETNEGTTWEALHFAVSNRLDNLLVMIDRNQLQGFGRTEDVLGDTAAPHLYEAMGCEVIETDGHDIDTLSSLIADLKTRRNGLPKVLVANTNKGRGVDYMENQLSWHYTPMSAQQYEQACLYIKNLYLLPAEATV